MLEVCLEEAVLGMFASFLPLTLQLTAREVLVRVSVGDVSLTAAKCISEKVVRSLLASVFACVAETPGARQLPHHLSWHRSRCSSHCHYQHSSWVWCHGF